MRRNWLRLDSTVQSLAASGSGGSVVNRETIRPIQSFTPISITFRSIKLLLPISRNTNGRFMLPISLTLEKVSARIRQLWSGLLHLGVSFWSFSFFFFFFPTDNGDDNCNILQTIFDPNNAGTGKSIGDIDSRLGKLKVATDFDKKSKIAYRDLELALLPGDLLGPQRVLYVVIFHPTHDDSFLACAKIKHRKEITAKWV